MQRILTSRALTQHTFLTQPKPTILCFSFRTVSYTSQEPSFNQQKKEMKKSKPEYLYGINPVYAALRAQRRHIGKLHVNVVEKENQKPNEKIQKVLRLAKE
jgi:hypothetical protein